MDYYPGDLVYFWRKQTKEKATGKHGMFLGPARVLATETKRKPDGSLEPGSSIWCVRGRRLIKCCVEQLRPASQREELLEHLSKDDETATPWTFPRVADELGGNEFDDITAEKPDDDQWEKICKHSFWEVYICNIDMCIYVYIHTYVKMDKYRHNAGLS